MGFNPYSREEVGAQPIRISNGASLSPAIKMGEGYAIYGFKWPNLRNSVKISFLVAESAGATYVPLLRQGGLDSTSVIGAYQGTAASAAGAMFVPEGAPFKFWKVATSATLTSARTLYVLSKA